jgi:ketosteroid isomerase-like protein
VEVRAVWEQFFSSTPTARFEEEDIVGAGDRCVVRWRYTWRDDDEQRHIRGVDVLKVRDGKVAEKFAYVKG